MSGPAATPVSLASLRVEDRGPMPPHLSEYGVTPASWHPWQAMWGWDTPTAVKGCPLGTGRTARAAALDLLNRTNAESGTNYTLEN